MSVYDPREKIYQNSIRQSGSSTVPPLSYDERDAWTNVAINGSSNDNGMVQDVLENSPGELDAAVARQQTENDNFPTDANGNLQFDDGVGATDYPTDSKGSLQFDDVAGGSEGEPAGRGTEASFKVRLVSAIDVSKMVIFDVSPTNLSETNSAEYSAVEPVHMPGGYLVFKNTKTRDFSLNVKLISRTPSEATQNSIYLQRLRAWMRPYFGEGTRRDTPELLGAPPEVLYLYGYTNQQAATTRTAMSFNYHRIPVVIRQLSFSYQDNVDYIPTTSGEPMPIVMTVDLTLGETHSPFEYYEFSLAKYHQGQLEYF